MLESVFIVQRHAQVVPVVDQVVARLAGHSGGGGAGSARLPVQRARRRAPSSPGRGDRSPRPAPAASGRRRRAGAGRMRSTSLAGRAPGPERGEGPLQERPGSPFPHGSASLVLLGWRLPWQWAQRAVASRVPLVPARSVAVSRGRALRGAAGSPGPCSRGVHGGPRAGSGKQPKPRPSRLSGSGAERWCGRRQRPPLPSPAGHERPPAARECPESSRDGDGGPRAGS